MKTVLTTLLLLITGLAGADDYEEGMAAYRAKDYATAFVKLSAVAEWRSPSLEVFLDGARPDNPGLTEEELKAYWRATYGPYGNIHIAQTLLAVMYMGGHGVAPDRKEAMRWLTKAVDAAVSCRDVRDREWEAVRRMSHPK